MSTTNGPQPPPPPRPAERPAAPAADRWAAAADRRVTVIAQGTAFRGELVSSDPVEVYGTLEGDAHVTARLTVAEGGRVFGNIDAAALVVAGEVNAGMLIAGKIELRATANVTATLRARIVSIAEGAHFEGDVDNRDAPGAAPGTSQGTPPVPGVD